MTVNTLDLGSILLAKLDDEQTTLPGQYDRPFEMKDRPLTPEELELSKYNILQIARAMDYLATESGGDNG